MLYNLDDLHGFAIEATDGEIGHVRDIYFDDQLWVVRYFVVETGSWLSSRKVLISPLSAQLPDWKRKVIPVSITQEQVRNSPDIDTDRPVSRQHEGEFLAYYAFPMYWDGPGIWAADGAPNPSPMEMPEFSPAHSTVQPVTDDPAPPVTSDEGASRRHSVDRHLRSSREVRDYRIHGTDGDIGRLQGLLIDEKTWAIDFLIVNTSDWWLGQQVLIAPGSILKVSWFDSLISLDQTREAIREAPRYQATSAFERPPGDGIHPLRGTGTQ